MNKRIYLQLTSGKTDEQVINKAKELLYKETGIVANKIEIEKKELLFNGKETKYIFTYE